MRFLIYFGLALAITVAVVIVALSIEAFTTGGFCSWPSWTKPYIQSVAWGVCKP